MAKDKKNKLSDYDQKEGRIAPELETDAFSKKEQKEIVEMIRVDYAADVEAMREWQKDREMDIKMYEGERPSIIENLDKDDWMSDRNLGLCASVTDAYQATLLSTCWNPDTIKFKANEKNDRDYKDNLVVFTKWMVGKNECNVFPEVDDFIHNRIAQGTSVFHVRWEVKYEKVDRRIPRFGEDGKFKKLDIETEVVRFERGVLENIDDLDDLLYPTFGDTLQKKEHLIHVVHKNAAKVIDEGERGLYMNTDEEFEVKLKKSLFDKRDQILGKEKAAAMGLKTADNISSTVLREFPVDLHVWYGPYEKNGETEEYRFIVEPITKTFLSGKPLRKITRRGKRPFVGGGLIRRPGLFNGKSLPRYIKDPVNTLNNVYNQKADYQTVINCPTGFYRPDEAHKKQEMAMVPGILYPSTDPSSIVFPTIPKSTAWATEDINLLLQMVERLTGAASYFMSNDKGVSGTATRDRLINEKSQVRFGLWVSRIIDDITEALNMLLGFYQDWAPPDLGARVLGEDGKQLFNNLSIESLQGHYDVYMEPDIISGSKTLEREIALWGFENLNATLWFNPQINPRGNWRLTVDTAKKMGMTDVESYMPPQPPDMVGNLQSVKDKITQIKQGQQPEVEEGDNPVELFAGFMQFKEQDYESLDKEYRPVFDQFLSRLYTEMIVYMQKKQQDQMANQLATQMILERRKGIPVEQ